MVVRAQSGRLLPVTRFPVEPRRGAAAGLRQCVPWRRANDAELNERGVTREKMPFRAEREEKSVAMVRIVFRGG